MTELAKKFPVQHVKIVGLSCLDVFPLPQGFPFRNVGSFGLVEKVAWLDEQSISNLHFKGAQLANVMSSLFIRRKVFTV